MSTTADWQSYLTRGVRQPPHFPHIYHMAIRQDFEGKTEYFPPTFAQDGFIHATAEPKFLLQVGNNFYKTVLGDWICLKIDVGKLLSKVVYEPAMPVGDIQSMKYDNEPLFPHIYGSINAESVVEVFDIIRSLDGSFHSITDLVDSLGDVKI